jgi:hypothetical protein
VSFFKVNRFVGATRVLAVLLAGMVLCFELLANSEFHQALHHSGNAASDQCALCLFANAHVDSPQSEPDAITTVQPLFDSQPRVESICVVDFTYLAAPSRAPPTLAGLHPAVA